jgi:(p)ppGpp synthase/HD superfamily hydrolase
MADIQRAIEIAVTAHKGQLQKNGLPYILHPLTLMLAVSSMEAKITAVLHDVIEDTEWQLDDLRTEGFSESVIQAIDCLTHREGEDYDCYIDRISNNPIAREVKLADLTDNMNLKRLPTLQPKDFPRIEKYHRAWLHLQQHPPQNH